MELSTAEPFFMDTDPYEVVINSESSQEIADNDEIKLEFMFPQNYREIYESYKMSNYRECIRFLENVQTDFVQYRIVKSACLIHMDDATSYEEAHRILNETLEYNPNNSYTWYAKGLALYREMKWNECITYFDKSICLNPDLIRADVLRARAQDRLDDKQKIDKSKVAFESDIVHHRETPENFHSRPMSVEDVSQPDSIENLQGDSSNKTQNRRMKSKNDADQKKPRISGSNDANVVSKGKDKVKCKICLKDFKRNSIVRHTIIHSGKKPFKVSY